MKLEVKLTREVSVDEVRGLIWGTGALGYPWWGGVTDGGDGTFEFTHDGPDSEEGALDKRTATSAAAIAGAAGVWLSEQVSKGGLNGDIQDAITEDLGYLDAAAADSVLQVAVMKEVVFG